MQGDLPPMQLGNKYHLTDTTHASLCSNYPNKFAHDHGIEHHFKVSAKEGNRVEEIFEAIAYYTCITGQTWITVTCRENKNSHSVSASVMNMRKVKLNAVQVALTCKRK